MTAFPRRVKILVVDPDFLLGLLMPPDGRIDLLGEIENPLPADTRFLGVHQDPWSADLLFKVTSGTFERVREGQPIPVLDPIRIRRIDRG